MKFHSRSSVALLMCLAAFASAPAQSPSPAPATPPAASTTQAPDQEELKRRLKERMEQVEKYGWSRQGTGKLGNRAEIVIPKDWRFTDGNGTRQLMVLYGNPATDRELGTLAQEGIGDPPWIIFEFDESGYVKDDDKDELNADDLLASLQEGQKAGNEYRRKNGMDELEILGWAVPPRYNEKTHNLEWATKLHSIGSPADEISINFNTRLLGREGVMEVTLVCEPDELNDMIAEQEKILTGFSYIEGQRYAEYRAGDKIAEYGLTGLVAGGAAFALAKSGFFTKFAKPLIIGAIAMLAAVKKFFGKLFGARQQD
jgi:uncharacterized membrane-anchored protein